MNVWAFFDDLILWSTLPFWVLLYHYYYITMLHFYLYHFIFLALQCCTLLRTTSFLTYNHTVFCQ
jgi:hypothetical protein